jgi:hypothetical protein
MIGMAQSVKTTKLLKGIKIMKRISLTKIMGEIYDEC